MTSQSQSNLRTNHECISCIEDTIIFLLTQDHHKHPIKRSDIVKNALQSCKNYARVIAGVQQKMEQVFGLRLVEIGRSPAKYIIVNKFASSETVNNLTEKMSSKQTLLLIILSYIFMSGSPIKEDDLWKFLEVLGLIPDSSRIHPVFGDLKSLVTTEFVREAYLNITRIPGSEPPTSEYTWGERADKECSKRAILNFVSEMHGQSNPKLWTEQWKAMEKSEEDEPGESYDSS